MQRELLSRGKIRIELNPVSVITSSDTRLGKRARVLKPIEITDRSILVYHQWRRNIHPAHASLHDVMRTIGNGVWSLNVEPLNFELP